MALDDHGIGWWLIEKAVAVAGAIATALGTIAWRRYEADRNKIQRHEERLNENDREIGAQKEHRTNVSKAPMGDQLNSVIAKHELEHRKLHARINRRRKENETNARDVLEIKRDIKWLCRQHGR